MGEFTDHLGRSVFVTTLRDGRLELDIAPGQAVCDFCTHPEPKWEYPCGPVAIVGNDLMDASDDEWAACDRCHELIEAGDPMALVQHAVKAQRDQPLAPGWIQPPVKLQIEGMIHNVMAFMKARKGPARPWSEPSA